MFHQGVLLFAAEHGGGEYAGMEGNIVLGHELEVLYRGYVFRGLPPLTPFLGVVCCDGNITDWSVKPYIEDLQLRNKTPIHFNIHNHKRYLDTD